MATKQITRIALLLAIVLNSCNIFETRTPEPPAQTSSNYTPPVNASDVFDNMQYAFSDLNTVNYLKSFSDSNTSGRSFEFDPSPQARSQYVGVFLNWTKQSEQQYFDNMRSKIATGSTATLNFTTLDPVSIQSDSAQYDADYQLTIPQVQPNTQVYEGRAQFFLLKDPVSSTWTIWHWIDFRDAQNDIGWSDLKGAFAQ